MDRELKTPPWWADAGALAELVTELRAAGFRVGAEHVAAARRLALTRLAAGEHDAGGLGELLAPVVCSSPAEQEAFPGHFAAWERRRGRREREAAEERREPKLARAIAEAERRRRRWLLALALAAIAALGAVLLWPPATDDAGAPPPTIEEPDGSEEPEPEPIVPPPGFPSPDVFVDPLPDTTPLPEKPQTWQEQVEAWLAARRRIVAAGGTALGLLLAAYLLWRLRARRALQRRMVEGELDMGRLPIAEAEAELFGRRALARAGRELRRRSLEGALELDAGASAEASARRGGWLTPVFRRRATLPVYLALIERQSAADPQARLAEALLDGLEGVTVHRFYFRGDPRAVSPAFPRRGTDGTSGGAPIALERLAKRFGSARLLLFAEASCLFSPRTGTLAPWTRLLRRWRERALLTPLEPARWGVRERLLAREVAVLPATPEGLAELLRAGPHRWRGGGREDALAGDLARRPRRWLARRPPTAPAAVAALLGRLRAQLGEPAWYWLSACAAYPQVEWHLVLRLGQKLRSGGAQLLAAPRLAALGRLPWLRRAFLPDWLRARLLADLPPERQARVRAVVGELLVSALDGGAAVDLEVALGAGRWLRPIRRRRGAAPEPLRDEVLLRFLAGRRLDPLAVPLPGELAGRWPGRGTGRWPWALAAAVVLALALWWSRPAPETPDAAGLTAPLAELAAELGGVPMPRLEAGMHTASITRIDVDAAGRWLVTGSDDKTVRLWSLADGRLLRVLRPPSGAGYEGKVYAVALSPGGELIAAGGWTTPGLEPNIYLFDRRSGRLLRHIPGLPNVVNHLAFSPDGRRVAATLGGSNGLRVFGAGDGEELFRDADYGGDSYGAGFDPSGRLVTSCDDGQLRLYDGDGRRLAAAAAPGSSEGPFAVAFSPDGRRIAVGYADSIRVDVLSGDDLTLLWSTDSAGANNNLSKVAWSADGEVLYAAGRFRVDGRQPVRRWADAGRGSFRDLPGPASTVRGLRALTGGRLVFGAGDPAWGVFDPAAGEAERLERVSPLADLRGLLDGFRVDPGGETMRFAYEFDGARPALFDLPGRRLLHDPPAARPGGALAAPRATAPGLEIEDWKNTVTPSLDGEPLALKDFERSRSLAIAEDGGSFLLGTEWRLRLFDRDGGERWQKQVPGAAWAVNLTPDGRLALAAFGDGTIRWFRVTDGEELLAFFPHADGRRWVLFTPSGYYDASPGEGTAAGESLFGWAVNRGPDQADDFYSAARFKDRFRRPDVIDRVLTTLDEAEAVAQADAARAGV